MSPKSPVLTDRFFTTSTTWEALGGSDGKEPACNAGDTGCFPGREDALEKENDYPLQYSCLENSTNRGAWWVTVHGVAKNQTQMSS